MLQVMVQPLRESQGIAADPAVKVHHAAEDHHSPTGTLPACMCARGSMGGTHHAGLCATQIATQLPAWLRCAPRNMRSPDLADVRVYLRWGSV